MSKEPWEEQVFPETEHANSRHHRKKAPVKTPILTILVSIFFVIFVGILLFMLYTSNGNTSHEQATTGFYGASTSQNDDKATKETTETTVESTEARSETTTSETTVSETTSVARNGGTTTVQAGEGAGQIAARSGISLEQLYALNPEKMVGPGGTWWANPGDVVYIN